MLALENVMGDTVRFTEILMQGGKPKLYLPLADPQTDRAFTKAEREDRVVTLKQIPTGNRKDFGVVGALREKYVSYLIFPKRLTSYAGKRVVGIKYDQVDEETSITPQPSKHTKPAFQPKKPTNVKLPKPPPAPKRFLVRVRLTATKELEQTIEAMNLIDAKRTVTRSAKASADFSDAEVLIKVISVSPAST
jgi:hypothetical protein